MAAAGVGAEVDGDPRTAGRVATVIGVLFGLAGTGTSAVAVALPELAAGLGVTAANTAWVISGYAVALAVLTAVHGRIADIVGVRPGPGDRHRVGAELPRARARRGTGLGRRLAVDPRAARGRTVRAAGALARCPHRGQGERFDGPGAVFVAVAAAGLVLLIQSPATGVVVAVVGAVLLATGVPASLAWIRARPDGFLPRAIVTNGVVLRSAFAAAAIPAGWFALLVAVPLVLAARGWSPLGVGLVLAPPALLGLLMPRVTRRVLPRWGADRILAVVCPLAVVALLVTALGAAIGAAPLLVLAVASLTVAFGVGQPAMILAVSGAVGEAQRGVALGLTTLLFLAGAGVGAAVVGGLGAVLGISGALSVLVLLPIAGTLLMLRQLRTAAPRDIAVHTAN